MDCQISLIGWVRGRLGTDLGFGKVIPKHFQQSNGYEPLTEVDSRIRGQRGQSRWCSR